MKTKPKASRQSPKSIDSRWATELVRERMKESQAINHLGFDVEKVEKGRNKLAGPSAEAEAKALADWKATKTKN